IFGIWDGSTMGRLNGVTNNGNFYVLNNNATQVDSAGLTIGPAGSLSVNDGTGNNFTYLRLMGGATLNGPGAVTLRSNGTDARTAQLITGNNNTDQAVIAGNGTVQGRGAIYGN